MDSSLSPKDEIWFLHVCHHISTTIYYTRQGCTSPWRQVVVATIFFTVRRDNLGLSVWTLFRAFLMAPIILRCLLDFLEKLCTPDKSRIEFYWWKKQCPQRQNLRSAGAVEDKYLGSNPAPDTRAFVVCLARCWWKHFVGPLPTKSLKNSLF